MESTEEYVKYRALCLPYMDKIMAKCDENKTPLSNRQWEFVLDQMVQLIKENYENNIK